MGAVEYSEHYTLEDYRLWEGDWELIYGSAYAMTPSPMVTHQLVSANIIVELKNKISKCPNCLVLSEIDYEISEDTIVRPDVLLICKEIDEKVDKSPEIIFEVLSPSTARRDETIKFDIYQKEGVKYYVLANPVNKVAKIYKLLSDGRFVKQGDFTDENYLFDTTVCNVDFDFSMIWRR